MIGESYLVAIFLPLADNRGRGFPPEKFAEMAEELKRQFNGVTVYDRKPARGKTQDSSEDIIIFEVMTADLERAWWDPTEPVFSTSSNRTKFSSARRASRSFSSRLVRNLWSRFVLDEISHFTEDKQWLPNHRLLWF